MPEMTKDNIISDIYYNVSTGYGSIKNTLEQAQKENPSIKYEDVKKWMAKQPNQQVRPYLKFNSYIAPFPRYEYQIDIMDMVDLTKDTTQTRYGLVVIDVFSKFGDVIPMNNKHGQSVYDGLVKIFQKMGYPMSVFSDDDGSFRSKVREFFDVEGINHIITLTHANVVERFIRTLKKAIHDRTRGTDRKWEDIIDVVVKRYNNTPHTSTGYKPIDAHKDNNTQEILLSLMKKAEYKRQYPNLNIGDSVKIFKKPKGFADRKGYKSRWSDSTYKIENIDYDMTLNKYYTLQGVEKQFHRHELLLING